MSADDGRSVAHHGLPDPVPEADETLLEDMRDEGLIHIEYGGTNTLKVVPSPLGRAVVEQHDRVSNAEAVADAAPLVDAVKAQADADNSLALASCTTRPCGPTRLLEGGRAIAPWDSANAVR